MCVGDRCTIRYLLYGWCEKDQLGKQWKSEFFLFFFLLYHTWTERRSRFFVDTQNIFYYSDTTIIFERV